MSHDFYGYRIREADAWPVLMRIRQWYQREHPFIVSLRPAEDLARERTAAGKEAFDLDTLGPQIKKLVEVARKFECRLRLFSFGEWFYVQVHEPNYFFHNHQAEQWPELEPVRFNSHLDLTPESERWEDVVHEILERAGRKEFFEFIACDAEDIETHYFQHQLEVSRLMLRGDAAPRTQE